MAISHATRPRSGLLGLAASAVGTPSRTEAPRRAGTVRRPSTAETASAPEAIARRRVRARGRSQRSAARPGLVLGGIIVAFLLAFFSLAQTVRVSAMGYDIERLLTERARLQALEAEAVSDLNRVGREPAVRSEAGELGLDPLISPLVVKAR